VAHAKHGEVRLLYGQRCGYCGVAEIDAAGELTVDHYRPVSAGGGDGDENLVYACSRCNLYKGDFWPSEEDVANGRRVLHPLKDSIELHLRLDDPSGHLQPLTDTGRFHITMLHLNRPALIAYRLRQRHALMLAEKQHLLEREIQHLRALTEAQARYINHLRQILGLPLERSE